MTSIPEEERWRIARDRVLLYVRSLDLPPFEGLDLAVQSLNTAGPSSPAEAMQRLRAVLREHGLDGGILDREGKHLASVPPLNRGVMVAERFPSPEKGRAKRFLRRWLHDLFGTGNQG